MQGRHRTLLRLPVPGECPQQHRRPPHAGAPCIPPARVSPRLGVPWVPGQAAPEAVATGIAAPMGSSGGGLAQAGAAGIGTVGEEGKIFDASPVPLVLAACLARNLAARVERDEPPSGK